jgi:hypothetical protein
VPERDCRFRSDQCRTSCESSLQSRHGRQKIRLLADFGASTAPNAERKCNVYCTPDPAHFATFNEIYARPGPFDVEVDCVALARSNG